MEVQMRKRKHRVSYGAMGKGAEFMTEESVHVKVINWQKLN